MRTASRTALCVALFLGGGCGYALDTQSDGPISTSTVPNAPGGPIASSSAGQQPADGAATDDSVSTTTTLPAEPSWCRRLGSFGDITFAVGANDDPARIEELMQVAMDELRETARLAPDPLGAAVDAILEILEPAIAEADAQDRWLDLRQIATDLQEQHPVETTEFLEQGSLECPSFAAALDRGA